MIPSYDYSGEDGNKAPRMQGLSASLVIPDLDIAKGGTRRWAEVKVKATALLWRKTGEYQHGIDRRHYEDYLRVEKITGCHVWLFILEEDTQTILAESLDKLGEPRFGPQRGKGGMMNWSRERFSMKVAVASVPGLKDAQPTAPVIETAVHLRCEQHGNYWGEHRQTPCPRCLPLLVGRN